MKDKDGTITTVGDFFNAIRNVQIDAQLYIDLSAIDGAPSSLIEVIEIHMVLPKKDTDKPYMVLMGG